MRDKPAQERRQRRTWPHGLIPYSPGRTPLVASGCFYSTGNLVRRKRRFGARDENPGYASAHQWLGFTLGLTMRLEAARAAMRIAQELDPFSASINTTAVWPVYWSHLFDEAIEGFRNAAAFHPGYWVAHYYLGLSYAHQGDCGQAILALRHAAEIGDSTWRYAGLGFVYAQAGSLQQAREVLAKLQELGRPDMCRPSTPPPCIVGSVIRIRHCNTSNAQLRSVIGKLRGCT